MGTGKALVFCLLLLFCGHVGLYWRNLTVEWREFSAQGEEGVFMSSAFVAFGSILHGAYTMARILAIRLHNPRPLLKKRDAYACFLRYIIGFWFAAAFFATIAYSDWFFPFAAYFVINAVVTCFLLSAFKAEIKSYVEFIRRLRKAAAPDGQKLIEEDAHTIYELLHHRCVLMLPLPSVWNLVTDCRGTHRLHAWQAQSFVTVVGWLRDLKAIQRSAALKEPKTVAALRSLIAAMEEHCKNSDLTKDQRTRYNRIVCMDISIGQPEEKKASVEVCVDSKARVFHSNREVVSAIFNEPFPPKYEQKEAAQKEAAKKDGETVEVV